ncbi:MAG: thioredoxin domain-containing protein [Oscillatoria sp. PMC 1068.18]|nr:thioredoxin domain-containing protein [Oscillatoria sp. PMC 1076.18]MEC4988136.1 thioredoxin domain-containing protein [Oscillatoria sp. PMC 1068.18]
MTKFRSFIFALLALVFVAGIFLANRADVAAISNSTVTGLAVMKEMAKDTVPYQVAVSNNKPTLIEFYADWCTTCQSLAPTLKSFHQEYGRKVNFVMLNVDDPQWRDVIKKYRVTGVPQLTFLAADRENSKTFIGKVPQEILEDIFVSLSR